jgi:hypothetical protein
METITITHSLSQEIMPDNSYSCEESGFSSTNRFFRRFTLADFGVTSDFLVKGVEVGFEEVTINDGGTTPAHLRLYTWDPNTAFDVDNFDMVINSEVQLSEMSLEKVMYPVSTTFSAGDTVIVEFVAPTGYIDGNNIIMGSNDQGQTDATFVIAPYCDVTELTDVADLDYPDMHWVVNLIGNTWVGEAAITLDKTVGLNLAECGTLDSITIPPGQGGTTVAYCYTVTNSGDMTLMTHDLTDDMLGTLFTGMAHELAPGASYSVIYTQHLTSEMTNIGTWTAYGEGEGGGISVTASDTATVTVGSPSAVTTSGFGAADGGPASLIWVAAVGLALASVAVVLRRKLAAGAA